MKIKVTIRKHGGDDMYSWAVFVNGVIKLNGLSQREARYYRDLFIKGNGKMPV